MREKNQKTRDTSKGITLVALVITVIVMLILLSVSINYGMKQVDKARLEDLKTEMIAIKGKAKIIAEKNSFDSTVLVGTSISSNTNNYGEGEFFSWSQEDLNNQELDTIKSDKYVVRYFTTNSETTEQEINVEVYYSDGYDDNGTLKYSLTEIENIQ